MKSLQDYKISLEQCLIELKQVKRKIDNLSQKIDKTNDKAEITQLTKERLKLEQVFRDFQDEKHATEFVIRKLEFEQSRGDKDED